MYKLHLILKYLSRRRIAWVSLLAVTLCTAMVIVVISIMGGWLRMFAESARGMTGDVIVSSHGLSGFPYYEEMVQQIEALPYVKGAVPQIKVYGLVNVYGQKTNGVQVVGVQIDKVGKVNNWPESLYQQHTAYLERGETPPEKKTFDLRDQTSVYLGSLPEGLSLPLYDVVDSLPLGDAFLWNALDQMPMDVWATDDAGKPTHTWPGLKFVPGTGELIYHGRMSPDVQQSLSAAAGAKAWRDAVRKLAGESNYPGMIAGSRIIDIKKDREGNLVGREPWKYRELWAKLTVFGVGARQEFDAVDRAERTYTIIDDSRTGMWQYDNNTVYVPFDVLQADLDMQAGTATDRFSGENYPTPARTSEINIRLAPGTPLEPARSEIRRIVDGVIDSHRGDPFRFTDLPRVETWREASAVYLDQIEREKVLVVLLFGVVSLVAVFLIFCIFYMIVAEKTKDIGIIKSVGATNGGVAGIFLGYGLAIGIVGAAAGLLISYLIVHNINGIHEWLGRTFRLVVYNPEVYAFDTIPNTMDPPTVVVILVIAVLASVVGALVPAIRAARMQPVEALRWE